MRIDLRSDTVTRPSTGMREAIARAEVGDDVYGEDPTVLRLQELAAERLGMEAALFVPSGTMANQIAIRAHTQPGDAVIAPPDAHIRMYEGGAAAAISGVQFTSVGEHGLFDGDDVRRAVHPDDSHFPATRLVCVENTHNRSGGRVFPVERLRDVRAAARECGLALHVDGARIFNAEVATGVPVAELVRGFDSVSFCLSKGLGAPVGSLVAGSRAFIARAHRLRKMLGGGMRQVGLLAAAGIWALERNVKRLEEDHANARRLADGLRGLPGLELVREPETNMVLLRPADASGFVKRARERGLLVGESEPGVIRAVTHLDVSGRDIDAAIAIVRDLAAQERGAAQARADT